MSAVVSVTTPVLPATLVTAFEADSVPFDTDKPPPTIIAPRDVVVAVGKNNNVVGVPAEILTPTVLPLAITLEVVPEVVTVTDGALTALTVTSLMDLTPIQRQR
jgi:hypothetical protein